MEIAKKDRHGQEDNIARVLSEEPHQLHDLGEAKHEDDLSRQEGVAVGGRPLRSGSPARVQEEWIDGKRQRREGGEVKGVCAPWLLTVGGCSR